VIKRFQLVEVAQITAEDGTYFYTLDGTFIGGWENGKILTAKDDPNAQAAGDKDARDNSGSPGAVVKPLPPREHRRQQQIEASKEISTLESRLDKAKGDKP